MNSKQKYIDFTVEHKGNDKLSCIDKESFHHLDKFINLFTENPLSAVF